MASAGMAYADRFPRLTFNLVGGWENDALQGSFAPRSRMCRCDRRSGLRLRTQAGQISCGIGGIRRSRLGYEKKVLEVFKEANDAVVTYRNVRKRPR